MIDVTIIKKPKNRSSSGKSTGNVGTTYIAGSKTEEAKHALTADRSTFSRQSDYAKESGRSSLAKYADMAQTLAEDSDVLGLFLSRIKNDTAAGIITFEKGLVFPGGSVDETGNVTVKSLCFPKGSIDKTGIATINTLKVAEHVTSDTFRTSDSFVAGLLGASGALWEDENGVAHLHTDELVVRQTMTILETIIQKAKVVGGMLVVSDASGKITDVTYDDNNVAYLCTIADENDGRFQVGDLARCSRWDKSTNTLHSYWEEVEDVFEIDEKSYQIQLAHTSDSLPQVGDNLVLMGNVSDTSRQGFITISVEGGTPKIDEYDGVKTKSLVGCLKGRFGDLSGITWQGEELSGYGIWTENLCATGKLVVDGKPISDYIATKTTEALGDAQGANRNLLVGTNQGTTNWYGAYSTAPDGSSGYVFYKSEIEYQGQKGVQFDDNGDYADGSWFNMRYPIATSKLVAPKTYTVSVDVYLWDGVTETLYLYCFIRREADSGNPLTGHLLLHRKPMSGGWQHVTFVMPLMVAPDTSKNDYNIVFELRDANGGYRLINGIRFVNLMCGEGNIPSSWSPSPEDTETKINKVTTTYDSKFEVVNGQLTSLQTKTTELTTAIEDAEGNITDIEKRVTTNESSIKQNADVIALEVTNRTKVTDDLGEQISENTALIEQTASEIRSEVSQEITDVNGNIDAMYSQIKQEADSIALVINRDNKLAIQLGACNLLLGTARGLVDKWRAVDSVASLKKRQYTASDGTLGVEIYRDAVLSTTPSYEYIGYELLPEKIVSGKIYVVSFDIIMTHSASQLVYPRVCLRGIGNGYLSNFVRYSGYSITSDTKMHYDVQVPATASGVSGNTYVIGIDFVNLSNTSAGVWGEWTSVKITNLMLQELSADGTIQSYTQAPEDFPNALEETGIFINERQIKLKADNVQVENNDGETTFLLESDGRLNTNLITAKEIIASDDVGAMVASMNASNDRAYKVYHSNGNPMLVIGKYNVTDKDGVEWIMMISCFDEAGLFLWGIPYGTTGLFSTPTLPYNWSEVKFCDPSLYSLTDTAPTALMKVVQAVTYYKFNSDDTTSANQYAQYDSKVCYSPGVDGLSNPIADGIYWASSFATFANATNGVVTSYTHTRLGTKYVGGFPVNDGTFYRITWKTYPTADGNTELT